MSIPMKPSDPAYHLLSNSFTSSTTAYDATCYICKDPEFAQMGMPLCYNCSLCNKHVAADEGICNTCGHEECETIENTKIHWLRVASTGDKSTPRALKLYDKSLKFVAVHLVVAFKEHLNKAL